MHARRFYIVDAQVGRDYRRNYKLDVAVKNAKGEYAVGIECDDMLLEKDLKARERDVMRKKFLESRGWKLLRVWSKKFFLLFIPLFSRAFARSRA